MGVGEGRRVLEKLGPEGYWTLETFERGKQENLVIIP